MFKKVTQKFKDAYVMSHAKALKLPEFKDEGKVRLNVVFSGKVQKVGFRLELKELSTRIGVTGWAKNMPNGDVMAELQGPMDKIQYIIGAMHSLKRAKVKNINCTERYVVGYENDFQII